VSRVVVSQHSLEAQMRSHSTKAVNSSCNTIWMIIPITVKSQLTTSWGNPVTQANKKKENPEEWEGLLATYFSFLRISFVWLPFVYTGRHILYLLHHCWIPLPFRFDWRKINMLCIACKTLIDNIRAQILTQCVKCDVGSLACIYGCGCNKSYCALWTYLPLIWLVSRICLHMLRYVPIQILVVQRTSEG
jgi:hypothetical protein